MRYYLLIIAAHLLHAANGDSVASIDLISGWTLRNQNESIISTDIKLPSGVYSALYKEEVLDSYNDVNMRWIAYDNWTYINRFWLNKSTYQNVRFINLTFHGVDTVASIRLNGNLIGRTNNMFVRYSYDVTKLVQQNNLLEIDIKSPVSAALAKAKALEHRVPPNCPNPRYHGECHMNLLRKMQASFAWDWGLAAPSMGLWKPVSLELFEVALLRDVDVEVTKNETHWNMHVRVFMDSNGRSDFHAHLIFYAVELLSTPLVIKDFAETPISYLSPVIAFDVAIPIAKVVTWWPNGYGEQKLYPLHFTLNTWLGAEGPDYRSKTKSQKSISIGFRTIELIEHSTPAGDGNTFLFKVNGVEIFMKGTNYIPSHILPELSQDRERLHNLLKSVKDAHMNMIRVWGGGLYESDYFYDLADRYGILIWQDMMFACAMYPVDDEFLHSVRMEIRQNALRLSHHPSVAIFVTNNENEVALVQQWYGTISDRYKTEYRQLYLANIMHELKLVEHKSRPHALVSSPSNGKESEKDNFISPDPQSRFFGDVHFYDVLRDAWDANIYPRARFASEYGFQSLPSMYAWNRTLSPGDDLLKLISHRQHHPLAMIPITAQIHRHLPLPLPEDSNYAEALIYFSQISQAMATKIETELYRSLRETETNTMGALYWQLNDVWVAPSWSSIDFYGNWKLLHYWARDFLAPISIVALYDASQMTINISLICDELQVDTKNLQVVLNTYLWSELLSRNSTKWPVTLRPNGVQYDKVIPLADLLQGGFNQLNVFFEFELVRDGNPLSRTYYFPSPIKAAVGVTDPQLEIEISARYCVSSASSVTRNTYSLIITVRYPAIFVYLELLQPYKNIRFSQNGFMQALPVQVVYVEFESSACVRLRRRDIKVLTVNQFLK